jgi:hypothetical protein
MDLYIVENDFFLELLMLLLNPVAFMMFLIMIILFTTIFDDTKNYSNKVVKNIVIYAKYLSIVMIIISSISTISGYESFMSIFLLSIFICILAMRALIYILDFFSTKTVD